MTDVKGVKNQGQGRGDTIEERMRHHEKLREQEALRVAEEDKRRIEAGEKAPWLGKRETWLNP